MNTDNLVQNMIQAAKLNVDFYNAVEHDESKTSEALQVVIIAAIASAIGTGLGGIFTHGFTAGIFAALFGLLWVLAGYYLWSYLTFYIGVKLFQGEAEVGEVLRTFGYAQSPRVLGVFSFIPCIGWLISFAASIWALVASIIAIREAMDFDTGKAVLTTVIAWLIMTVVFATLGMLFGIGTLGAGAIMGR